LSTSDVTKKAQIGGDELIHEGLKIVELAKTEGMILRLTGGIAIFNLLENKPELKQLLMDRRKAGSSNATFADLDFVGYSKQTKLMNKLFLDELQFQKDKIINSLFGDRRRIYYHPQGTYHVDILLDILEFNHDIDIRGRLEAEYPNLNKGDLLLTKLQIHFVNEKDLLDIIALCGMNPSLSEADIQRVVELLSDDWGFYYDAINNLKLASESASKLMSEPSMIPQLKVSSERIPAIIAAIEQAPKTKKWQKRAKQGSAKTWWREIEDVLR
jgi:hypothetical protein